MKTSIKKMAAAFIMAIAAVLAVLIAAECFKADPALTEALYSRRAFINYNAASTGLAGLFPFSLAEPFCFWSVLTAAVSLVCAAAFAQRKRRTECALAALTALVMAGSMYASFYMDWGLNYYRQPLGVSLNLAESERSNERLLSLIEKLNAAAARERKGLQEDESGVTRLDDAKKVCEKITPCYEALRELAPEFVWLIPARAKRMLISPIMSHMGISGIYIPFTREANINAAADGLMTGVTAAHEAAHLLGIAREDEANFVGFVAASLSGDPQMRYSAYMLALLLAGNALSDTDGELYSAAYNNYDAGVRRDMDAYDAFWKSFEGEVREMANDMNDSYLKSNGQSDGTQSYGRMVELMLDADAAGWLEGLLAARK